MIPLDLDLGLSGIELVMIGVIVAGILAVVALVVVVVRGALRKSH